MLWHEVSKRFSSSGIPDADLEARLLLEGVLGVSQHQLLMGADVSFSDIQMKALSQAEAKRISGVPLAYILGDWEFAGHTYCVSPGVLIPRPETEEVLDHIYKKISKLGWEGLPFRVIEVGVGSGILSIELALRYPLATVVGWEINPTSVEVATRNALNLGAAITVFEGDFFEDESKWGAWIRDEERVILVSNPPYVSISEYDALDPLVKNYEPKIALVGGADGLDYYRLILESVSSYRSIPMVFEVGTGQGEAVVGMCDSFGWGADVYLDMAGHDRIVVVN